MSENKRRKPTASATNLTGVVVSILFGSLLNIIIYAELCAAASFVCLKSDIGTEFNKYFIFLIAGISGFFGGFKAVRTVGRNGLLLGAVSAFPSFLIIFLISSILSRTGIAYPGWIAAAVMTLFSAAGGIVGVNKRR